jgi:hypothetical protein
MATFALATFAVRLFMPLVVKRLRQWVVMSSAMRLPAPPTSSSPSSRACRSS